MKKLISLLLALVMVLSLAACGGDSKTPDSGSKTPAGNDSSGGTADSGKLEHMDISVGYWDVETALCGDDIQKFIEEKFNVTFEPMNVTWDDYYEKEQTWAATDSLPDVFCADFRASATFGKWAREGVIRSIPEALSRTELVCSSVNVGSTRAGINMDAVALMGRVVKDTAAATADRDGLGCAKLVVFCNAVEDNPFMAGAFHGAGEAEKVINVGVSGPGVVCHALQAVRDKPLDVVAETIKKTAFRVTRMGQLVAQEASRRLDTPFGIVDLSLAPTPAVGDSVARILEELGLEVCGTHGTTAALAMLNDAVKKGGVMASSSVGGLSGAFIPVSEDEGMIAAARSGTLCIDKLEAMTCVCSVGLDMIAIPGDTPAETIAAIIADEAAIGMVNNKTTAVRILPAPGKDVGGTIEMGGLLGSAPVMPVHRESSAAFIARGGRIPAPLHSLRN